MTRWGARFQGRWLACSVGFGGVSGKTGEGDGITPVGQWRVVDIWYRPDRVAGAPGWRPIGLRDAWCDDAQDAHYNRHILQSDPAAERLRRADHLYDLVGVLDYNMDPVRPGAGSAIFLHGWRKARHPTAGCVAFDLRDLETVLRNWTPRARVIVYP